MNTVYTKAAPEAIGPYSQAIEVGEFLFTSGQIPVNPVTNEVVKGGIHEQTEQVMENLRNLLKENQKDFTNVVKTTCFLRDMADFPEFNKTYETYFIDHKPARSTVAVRELPKNVLVEVEVIAVKSK
ncbi:endoribonuclease L-PSP [Neobacillus bataviensis LMG 21833]|uniref:Endoribonuclease L-PSP n=1 Tax=Neobacillus bataviensis LMG 21833 TaxID=1117379 RepID=K6DTR5_9BACI|nr:RidA family protein [Neobacillus bataviensis]EKN71643.1 endoribonuclease L-PSP [Neobacillus bataviensis LMG 21833]